MGEVGAHPTLALNLRLQRICSEHDLDRFVIEFVPSSGTRAEARRRKHERYRGRRVVLGFGPTIDAAVSQVEALLEEQ